VSDKANSGTQYGRFLLFIKIAAGDEQGLKGIMEMADTIVINKADAITFERHNSRNQFNRALLHLSKKSQAGFLQLQLAALTRRIPEVWETTKFIELTKSNDYFNEKKKRILDARGYQRTIEG
jgi:putative protein kinase ArgK-like GTPase of G3E family